MKRLNNVLPTASVGLGLSGLPANAAAIAPYFQTNLVSNLSGVAAVMDPNLQNPWGVAESATSPAQLEVPAVTGALYTG
jgi:hypothetical protein